MVLEKTLESPLDSKEIQPVHPKGDQSWVFFGRNDAEAESPALYFFFSILFYFILFIYFLTLFYNTVLILPYIDMNPPRVYMRSQT